MIKQSTLLIAFVSCSLVFTQELHAQSSFQRVYDILQTNCTNQTCHTSVNTNPAGGLDLDQSQSAVYNALVNATPSNPVASGNGYKLIDPGHPHNSYLLKKINNSLDPDNGLLSGEGDDMPATGGPLSDADIELVRQWIYFGAPQNGTAFDAQLIEDYYNGMGLPSMPKPAPPAEGEGFQVHFGPFFLEPLTEVEYFKKHNINLPDSLEVIRIESFIHDFSHHYLIYQYDNPAVAQSAPNGLKAATLSSTNDETLVAAWQFNQSIDLPLGTAYFWDPGTTLDLNYHILNYSFDSILKAEAYTNIYTRPKKAETVEMHSDLIIYAGGTPYPFSDFLIPADGQNHVFSEPFAQPLSNDTLRVWLLSTHTHKYGLDYDIFLRNENGSKGEQVYEGFYNVDYTLDQGYFDWEHPAVRYFDDFLYVPLKNGLIHEATFNNSGPADVTFGLTTDDEMMLYFIQYTMADPTEKAPNAVAPKHAKETVSYAVFPNPSRDQFHIQLNLPQPAEVSLRLFDVMGKEVAMMASQTPMSAGQQRAILSAEKLAPGVYMLQLQVDEMIETKKLVVTD